MVVSFGAFRSFISGVPTVPKSLQSVPSLTLAPPSTNLRVVRMKTSAAKAATTGNREPRGITKPRRVSPEMQNLLGVSEIPRTQALKMIWAYIKEHNLQDPENKKVIVCDEKLKTVFAGKERVGFLEIAGLIGPHFIK